MNGFVKYSAMPQLQVLPGGGLHVDVKDRSVHPSQSVWLCTLANIGNVFALTFITLYLTFGQFLKTDVCVSISVVFLAVAISTIVVLRKKQLRAARLETFMEPVRNGYIAHRGGAADAPENTLLSIIEVNIVFIFILKHICFSFVYP